MSRKDGVTFPNTIAALNKQTVSGNLWKKKERFFDVDKSKALDILSDIEEHSLVLTDTTLSELAKSCKNLIKLMDDMCKSLIVSVENEECNANIQYDSYDARNPHIAENPFE